MDRYGGRWMYRGSSALSLLVFLIHATVLLFSRTCCVSSRKHDDDDEDSDNVMYTPLEDESSDRDDNNA